MQSFLDSVLDEIPEWESSSDTVVFILPSKRSGFFLRQKMAARATRTLIAPRVLSIEEFVADIAGHSLLSSTDLLFRLYQSYLSAGPEEKEGFNDFIGWGNTLLQDFNEIDRYLVPAESLFETLAALNEIRHWGEADSLTPLIQRQLEFWKHFWPIYEHFRANLLSEGLAYSGLLFREATAKIPAYLTEHKQEQFIFLGFNAMNAAEQFIVREFLAAGRARIFWDADRAFIEDPIHDAGLFMRQHLKQWPELKGTLEGTGSYWETPREIHLVGLPKAVSQAKYCGSLIQDLLESGTSIDRLALVLADEGLLQPMLHSIPASAGAVNITMGYPISGSSFAQVFQTIFELLLERRPSGYRTSKLLNLLAEPDIIVWLKGEGVRPEKLRTRLLAANFSYTSLEQLIEAGLPSALANILLPENPKPKAANTIQHFLKLIETLKESFSEKGESLGLAYLHRFFKLFSRLDSLLATYGFVTDLKGLHNLYKELLAEQQVDFEGEPLKGLQLMGMLESRNLDFDTVILTSVNEGILPAGKSHASFIPYALKKQYMMPTFKEKDAVYTYHFYRLLQRAKKIYICYNTEPEVLEGSEPSRFIQQLRTDPALNAYVREHTIAPQAPRIAESIFSIPNSPALLERLKELGERGFSPTALSRLIADPMVFYTRNVLEIRESDTLESTIAHNTFGTVLHEALEQLYRPYVDQLLQSQHIADMQALAAGAIETAYQKHYLSHGRIEGRNLIALEVLKQYATLFLQAEMKYVKNHKVRLLAVEEKIKLPFPIPNLDLPVFLKGTVDRIEEVDGQIHIIDYKSGAVTSSQLRVPSWEELISGDKRAKAFQLLCYSWLYARHSGCDSLQAANISFKNLSLGRQWVRLAMEKGRNPQRISQDDVIAFEEVLQALLSGLFDPDGALVAQP